MSKQVFYQVGKDEAAINNTDGFDWVVVDYKDSGYEGNGVAVGMKDGELYERYLDHCSCYGPGERAEWNLLGTPAQWREQSENVLSGFSAALIEKVEQLLGGTTELD